MPATAKPIGRPKVSSEIEDAIRKARADGKGKVGCQSVTNPYRLCHILLMENGLRVFVAGELLINVTK